MPSCRLLEFQDLEEVMPEVERLMEGHTTLGQWTLGQILDHLATAIRLSTIGPRDAGATTGSEALKRRFFSRGRFPEGVQAPHPRLIPAPDADEASAADSLRGAIAAWSAAAGPFPDHPLLGSLSRAEWERFHCIHCAHHLGFALPA